MYRNCIFCTADLGTNEAIESFTVGRRLAFDPWKGRLWVVCPACARWNLTAVEERWEAVEDAERLFRDATLRVQSENVGLAKLPDGTMLIRVGEAVPGEMAAWRYGGQLVNRRKRYLITTGAGIAAVTAVWSGIAAAGMVGSTAAFWSIGANAWEKRKRQKVVHRLPNPASPNGEELLVRRWHVRMAQLKAVGGALAVSIPDPKMVEPKLDGWGEMKPPDENLLIVGADAHKLLNRSMVHVNHAGASRKLVSSAVQLLSEAGTADRFLQDLARRESLLGKRKGSDQEPLSKEGSLAVEMALHEETERRAMDGELALLTAAWKEAEEIAAIADLLPFDPLERLMKHIT